MPQFIVVPSAQVTLTKITSLAGCSISATPIVSVSGGTYFAFATGDISASFTPIGPLGAAGPQIITGVLPDQILIAPSVNFNAGNELISLSGCFVSTSGSITGLVNGTAYRAVGLTAPSALIDVQTVPDAFTVGQWTVTDAAIGGAVTFNFTALPYNGRSTIAGINVYENGSATPISTGLSGPGSFTRFGLTNSTPYSYRVAAVNAIGTSALSDTKSATPTQPVTGGVPSQPAPFGDRTLASAGRFRPLDSNGLPVTITAVTGLNGATGGSLINGGLAFSAAGGGTAGQVWRLTHSGGTVDVTITKLVDHYSVASEAEIFAALANNGSLGGRTIILREGQFTWSGASNFTTARTFAAPGLTLKGSGYIHGSDNWPSELTGAKFVIRGTTNLTVRELAITMPNGAPASDGNGIVEFVNATTNVNIIRCRIGGKYHDPSVPWPSGSGYANIAGLLSKTGGNISGRIEENLIHDVKNGADLDITQTGDLFILCNELVRNAGDGWKLGGPSNNTGQFEFKYNVSRECFRFGGTHCDIMFQWSGTGTASNRTYVNNFKAIMNVAFVHEGLNYDGHQGATAFDDSPTTAPETSLARVFNNAVFDGNFIGVGNSSNHYMCMNGGRCAFNTIVTPSATYAGPSSATTTASNWPRLSVQDDDTISVQLNLPLPDVYCNIFESRSTPFNAANLRNVAMGKRGSVLPYVSIFGSPITLAPRTWDTLKQTWAPIDKTQGAFSNVGVYGLPRQISTWSYNEAYVLANKP